MVRTMSPARPLLAGRPLLACSETANVATRRRCVVDADVLAGLRALAAHERVSLAAICHAAWALVQWTYEGGAADEVAALVPTTLTDVWFPQPHCMWWRAIQYA